SLQPRRRTRQQPFDPGDGGRSGGDGLPTAVRLRGTESQGRPHLLYLGFDQDPRTFSRLDAGARAGPHYRRDRAVEPAAHGRSMKLSVVIPARDEAGSLEETLRRLLDALRGASIPAEIIVVDDGSRDDTAALVREIALRDPEVSVIPNVGRHGFGMAVRTGLQHMTGDAVAIVM